MSQSTTKSYHHDVKIFKEKFPDYYQIILLNRKIIETCLCELDRANELNFSHPKIDQMKQERDQILAKLEPNCLPSLPSSAFNVICCQRMINFIEKNLGQFPKDQNRRYILGVLSKYYQDRDLLACSFCSCCFK